MTAAVDVQPAGISCPDVTSHIRATVAGAAGTLASFLSTSAIPRWPATTGRRPDMVYIAAEKGNSDDVYVCWDGKTTPTATLGFVVPTLPNFLLIPKRGGTGIQDGDIKLFAGSGTQRLQVKFEFSQS